jgi:hypothetical protein
MSTLAPAITFRSAILQLLRVHQPHEEPDTGPATEADLPIEPEPPRPSFEDLQTVPAVYNPLPEFPPVQPGLPAPDWCGC